MNSRERLLAALDHKPTDYLPATTHHIMEYFLNRYMDGKDIPTFFREMGLNPIHWVDNTTYTEQQKENWRIEKTAVEGEQYPTDRYYFHTPKKTLSLVVQNNGVNSWITEHLIKDKNDIEIIAEYLPSPAANREQINAEAAAHPEALIRGAVPCFDIFGQPGCWQDLACLYGIENLIIESYDDPQWVKEFLGILQKRKLGFVESLNGVNYDILELGGGDASTTVISPAIFNEFVAPFDAPIIEKVREKGIRVVYHTCGGMMPILEDIAAMNPNAMETFTPPDMGGDVDLAKAKKRIGDRVCMIGGFDQFHFFTKCTEEQTRAEVRRCFEAAGEGGGFIISPSDHFFDADPTLIRAFADEATKCRY